jgi:hypothetical protein
MRRLSVILGVFSVIAVPAAALAAPTALGDGSLVVKNGSAPVGTPVVSLTITGSVIGHVDHGKIIIDTGVGGDAPDVTGAEWRGDLPTRSDTAQVWKGQNFKFRAVAGKNMVVLVYGSGVDLVAIGKGTVKLAGLADSTGDGRYSLNGAEFVSLPGTQTDKRTIGSNG